MALVAASCRCSRMLCPKASVKLGSWYLQWALHLRRFPSDKIRPSLPTVATSTARNEALHAVPGVDSAPCARPSASHRSPYVPLPRPRRRNELLDATGANPAPFRVRSAAVRGVEGVRRRRTVRRWCAFADRRRRTEPPWQLLRTSLDPGRPSTPLSAPQRRGTWLGVVGASRVRADGGPAAKPSIRQALSGSLAAPRPPSFASLHPS
mmetsp:Transcript_7558/g.46474  ORF Transcript_7558/g.46474 Transcript_7558/m.46474 type:complete len:208 (+) Transcript_7558:5288-5911(+)